MEIRLNWLSLKNFKGIKDFTLNAKGKNVTVRGDNATGKTTLMDSMQWLLFDKDSSNSSKFSVKPLDENGNEIHFLETEVEAELLVDGKPLKLKKVLTENWVKPRGQEHQEYKGNTTTYYFDEVPVGANVYKQKVSDIVDEDTFRLITNPMYFNTQYKKDKLTDWQSRRVKLFEICGGLSDDEIIASTPKLAKLPGILNGKSVEDRKTIIKSSIKKLNDDIDQIGPKINENMRLIPEYSADYSAVEKELDELKSQLDMLDKQLTDAGNVAIEYRQKQQKLYSLKGLLEEIKGRIDTENGAEYKKLVAEKQKLTIDKNALESEIKGHNSNIDLNNQIIEQNTKGREKLLNEWKELTTALKEAQAEEFIEPGESFKCPTCGQDLPQEAKEQKLAEMRENFRQNKLSKITNLQNRLSVNISHGKATAKETEDLKQSIKLSETKITEAQGKIAEIDIRLAEIEQELSKDHAEPDYSANPEYAEVIGKIEQLEAELNKPVEDTTAELRQQKQAIQAKIDNCNSILNNRNVVINAKARIEELKQQEKEMAVQKSALEGHLFLLEEFLRAKTDILSDSINKRFKHVRFKLFNQLQNGGLEECCDTLVNTNGCWVPYKDGNTAGVINAGLDIINALSEFHGVTAPIFIDNAESITDIIPINAQVIKLVKPDITTDADRQKYSKLNVEVE